MPPAAAHSDRDTLILENPARREGAINGPKVARLAARTTRLACRPGGRRAQAAASGAAATSCAAISSSALTSAEWSS
jgi:hypothetical protein